MGCVSVFERWTGQDVDEVFAYQTPMVVNIRDRRLGCIKYSSMVAVFVYVVLFQLVYNYGALLVEQPTGRVRLSLRSRTNTFGCDPVEDAGCQAVFDPVGNQSYCLQNSHHYQHCASDQYPSLTGETCLNRRNCTIRDSLEVQTLGDSFIFIPTREKVFQQHNVCFERTTECAQGSLWQTVGDVPDEYLSGIEDFTLLVDHAVEGAQSGLSGISIEMKGELKSNNLEFCRLLQNDPEGRFSVRWEGESCFTDVSRDDVGGHDVLPLWMWLAASGWSLDDPNEFKVNESVRSRGMVVRMGVEYTNLLRWVGATQVIRYTYTVSANPQDKFKTASAVNIVNSSFTTSGRIVKESYGVKIVFVQSGALGRFDFNTLALQLAAGAALFGVSAVFTDFLALQVLPQKEHYRRAKVITTDDFSDIRKRNRGSDDRASSEEQAKSSEESTQLNRT